MNVGVNYLREHMPQDCRVHYAITNTGGTSPNVVQANAEVLYLIRAPEMPQMLDLAERIHKVARGAAMMTETSVEIVVDRAATNLLPNLPIEKAMHANMLLLGPPPPFDEADVVFAREIQATVTDEAIRSTLKNFHITRDAFSRTRRLTDRPRFILVFGISKAHRISGLAPPMSAMSAG